MKLLYITTNNVVHHQYIADDTLAETAYQALIVAMDKYKDYDNDQQKVVTIATGHGEAAFRINQLLSVSIDDMEKSMGDIVAVEVLKKKLLAAVDAAGVPNVLNTQPSL